MTRIGSELWRRGGTFKDDWHSLLLHSWHKLLTCHTAGTVDYRLIFLQVQRVLPLEHNFLISCSSLKVLFLRISSPQEMRLQEGRGSKSYSVNRNLVSKEIFSLNPVLGSADWAQHQIEIRGGNSGAQSQGPEWVQESLPTPTPHDSRLKQGSPSP